MNTLTANIQREWLARILNGSKNIEYRDATSYWLNRLSKAGPPPFHLRLINGMRQDSPEATVLINKADIDVLAVNIRLHIASIVSTSQWDSAWNKHYAAIPSEQPLNPTDLRDKKYRSLKMTIEVPLDLFANISVPGLHDFTVEADKSLEIRLDKGTGDPMTLKLASGSKVVEVIAYQFYWDLFNSEFTLSVITP